MNPVTAFVLYVIIWWTVLFAVLPFGVQPNADPDPQTGWRGAPARPRLGMKVLATTLISAALWAAIEAIILSDWLSFRSGFPPLHGN
jgi:predicted secreted protein